jgi:hypothetical protein
MNQMIFRPKALQRVSSPEQLDKAVRLTLPRQWLALVALIAVIVAGVTWSTLSTVPTLAAGPGYLLPHEGLEPVASAVSGTITRFSLQAGQFVKAGENVGAVRAPGGLSVPLVSGFSGRITEIDDAAGDFAAAGQRLALIQPVNQPLVIYAYVPIREADGLPPGLPVRVTFEAGIGSAYGYAKGTIATISPYAASDSRLNWILQNTTLVQSVQNLGPVAEVVIRLTPSSHTASGWEWASGQGPPERVPSGVSAKIEFVLGSHHPINDVL